MKLSCNFVAVLRNRELRDAFSRYAMKKPVKVAGINKEDMQPQKSLV